MNSTKNFVNSSNLLMECLKSEKIESGPMYGQFLIDSLNSGQGITIGNLLRRVLLGDLQGTAITGVRIAGIKDEFSLIPGVREDILEILLNLKGIILKSKSDTFTRQFGRLRLHGPAVITASSIQLPPEIEIINPNHYIATISSSHILEIEFKIESGTKYRLANELFSDKFEDFIETDAIFMPVQKVDFKVENVYDNSNNIKERLFIDVWTNGSISPEQAIFSGSNLIIDLFKSIGESKIKKEKETIKEKNNVKPIDPYTHIAIEELQLSVRPYNCLKRAQINTIGDLLEYSPEKLLELKNFGRKSADEVFATLKNKLGIVLK